VPWAPKSVFITVYEWFTDICPPMGEVRTTNNNDKDLMVQAYRSSWIILECPQVLEEDLAGVYSSLLINTHQYQNSLLSK
jgi:hypothetical protein